MMRKLILKILRLWSSFRCLISKDYAYWCAASKWYYGWVGKKLQYRHPRNISEKLFWLTRYWNHPLKSECADKYRVRSYVESCGLKDILIPLLGVWTDAKDINFSILPNQFVLKCNHGCGYNIICKDKAVLDKEHVVATLNGWMHDVYGIETFELHYSEIQPCIICEKFLPSLEKSVIDYKIHCMNGVPQFFLVCSDRDSSLHKLSLSSYSLEWDRLDLLKEESTTEISCPKHLDEMIRYACVLSKPFPYVRVDLYEVDGKVYFGELSFTPQGNVMDYYKDDVLLSMGQKLALPPKYRKKR